MATLYRGKSSEKIAQCNISLYRAAKGTKICSAPRIFKTNCKLFMCAKGKRKTERDISPGWPQNLAEQRSGNNLFNSRILKLVSCINWESSFQWYRQCQVLTYTFKFYRNIKLYCESSKQASFSNLFDSSRRQICCVKTIIVTCTEWLKFRQLPFW